MEASVFVRGERARPDRVRTHPRAWLAAVATVCFGAFMGQLDASLVAVTYHRIGADFDAPMSAVQWVGLTYLIALAALLIPVGTLSDRLGRKRVYLWGFAIFGATSLVCALAPNLDTLAAIRIVQGIGAAMLQANSVALVATSAPRRRLRRALGIQAAAQALGLALGPMIGGALVGTIGWRCVFAVNVPIALAGIIGGRYLLPRTRLAGVPAPYRLRDVLTSAHMPQRLGSALLGYLALFAPIVYVPAVLQDAGVSPLHTGLVVAALPVGFAIAASGADRLLPSTWTNGQRCLCGALVTAAGIAGLVPAGDSAQAFVPGLFAIGVGVGMFTPANNALIMGSVPGHASALAGGAVNTARTLGTAAGTAVATAIAAIGLA